MFWIYFFIFRINEIWIITVNFFFKFDLWFKIIIKFKYKIKYVKIPFLRITNEKKTFILRKIYLIT